MSNHPILKKLQFKDQGQPVLVLNAPEQLADVTASFIGRVDNAVKEKAYEFVQVFGTGNNELQALARQGATVLADDGLLWLCYPKKSSKTYKDSDCSRETVATLLAAEGFEPVRQVALDDDWSALRLRHVDRIQRLTRSFAVTDEGKRRTGQ